MQTINEKIKYIRNKKQLTQGAFGEYLGVTRQAVANVEGGHSNPSLAFIRKLIETLNVNSNWLIADIGEPFNPPPFEDAEDQFTARVRKIIQEELAKKHNY